MNHRKLALLSLVLACAASQPGLAQKESERFIPLGQSPGLSGESTLLGVIESFDPNTGNATIKLDKGGSQVICLLPKTRLWLDRSETRQSNCKGDLPDLKPGRRIEAKAAAGDPGHAEWVKVQEQ